MSLRDQIIAADDIESEVHVIPQWGDAKIIIKGMSGAERARHMTMIDATDGKIDYATLFPSILVNTLLDPETGAPIFSESDIPALNAKSGKVLEDLSKIALRLSGMDTDEQKKAAATFQDES